MFCRIYLKPIIHARACFDVKVVDDVLLWVFFFDIRTLKRQAKHFYLDKAPGGAFFHFSLKGFFVVYSHVALTNETLCSKNRLVSLIKNAQINVVALKGVALY